MITRSTSPDVTIPEVSITEYVLRHAERLGDKPALIDGPSGRTITYGQLREGIRRAAAGLDGRGFRKGDVFAIYSPNVPEYAVTFNAVASLGGINTTINPLYTVDELANQLRDSGARMMVTVPPFLDKAREAGARTGVEEIFVFGTAEGARPFAELLQGPPTPPPVAIDPRRDVVALPYSSGTMGLPKGVMLTHHNLVANLCQCEGMENFDGFGERDVVIAALPFFHIYGLVVIMKFTLAQGGTLVTMPRFDLLEFVSLIQKHRVTIAPIVPPIVVGMVKHPAVAQADLSSLRLVFSGAAPLGEEMARELSKKLGCPVVQGYGMTEASPVTHLSPTRNVPMRPGSIGRVVPSTEVKITDVASGEALDTGREGELLIRGPQAHQVQGAPGRARGARGAAPDPPRGARRRRHPQGGRGGGRGAQGVRRPEARRRRARHEGRGDHGLGRGARRAAQAHPASRVHRPDPQVGLGQDPAPHAGRPGEGARGGELAESFIDPRDRYHPARGTLGPHAGRRCCTAPALQPRREWADHGAAVGRRAGNRWCSTNTVPSCATTCAVRPG